MKLVGNTHLVAGGSDMIPAVRALLEEEGMETRGNPDVYVHSYQSFGIDEARELRGRASSRALRGKRVFVIATPSMTTEAQNALLKTLEEPAGEALFFFIVPSPQTLLPTLRSRAQIVAMSHINSMDVRHPYIDPAKFLAATGGERLEMLKPLLEKGEDDKRNLGAILVFLSALEGTLSSKREGLHAVYRARKYMMDRGALVKPLLEQLALLI